MISFVSGKDCSTPRIEQGKSYCVEDEVIYIEPVRYCYKTLASVSCYTTEDPGRAAYQRLGVEVQPQ